MIRTLAFMSLLLFLSAGAIPPRQEPRSDDRLWAEALRIHREAIVVDTHSDTTSRMLDEGFDIGQRARDGHMDIPRMREGGIDAQFFAIYVAARYAREGGSARRALEMIDVVYRALERYPNDLELALSSDDIRRIARQGKIAVLMGIEGGHAIEDSLGALRMFHRLGVRYMTLTHTNTNNWADSSGDAPRHNGLTEFGREVVREMNRLGMLVDISHVSDKTFYDVLEVTRAPVIASHSSARALTNIPRNMSDEMLRALARNGGVVMVNFGSAFVDQGYADAAARRREQLRPQLEALRARYANDPVRLRQETERLLREQAVPPPPLSRLIDHIDHIARVAGIDHVGLGSDFDGVDSLPEGLEDCSKLPRITYELLKRGYSERDIKKILGENFLRVMARAEEVARQMQRERR